MLTQFRNWLMIAKGELVALFLIAVSLAGCAEGMFSEYGVLNPTARRQWYLEEERYGFNLNSRLAELAKLRQRAKTLTAERRNAIANELGSLAKTERNPILRSSIVLTLAEMQDSTADRAILDRLQDDAAIVRRAACQAIAKRGGDAAVSELARVIQSDDDLDVRLTAAKEMGQFRQNDVAIRALGVMLDDSDPAVQYQAMRSLHQVTGKRFGNDVTAWRQFLTGGKPVEQPPTMVSRLFGSSW